MAVGTLRRVRGPRVAPVPVRAGCPVARTAADAHLPRRERPGAGGASRLPCQPESGAELRRAVHGQPRPHGLDAGPVGDAPGLGERGDEPQAPPVLGRAVRAFGRVLAHRA